MVVPSAFACRNPILSVDFFARVNAGSMVGAFSAQYIGELGTQVALN